MHAIECLYASALLCLVWLGAELKFDFNSCWARGCSAVDVELLSRRGALGKCCIVAAVCFVTLRAIRSFAKKNSLMLFSGLDKSTAETGRYERDAAAERRKKRRAKTRTG